MTADLPTWLRARLDEDEAALRDFLSSVPVDSGAADWIRQWLAEVDAKRRILDLHRYGGIRPLGAEDECRECVSAWPCPTVRLLAVPYADRPAYREEWRP